MGKKDESAQWISMSDMMTGLMLVFLLIAMAFMYEVQLKQKEKNKIIGEYNNSKVQIYNDFKKSFEKKENEWWMEINKDLSIKFNKDNIEFEPDQAYLKDDFKNILKEFLPEYLRIMNNPLYSENIKAIKIEWHTWKCLDSEYEECLLLSQRRANSVLLYLQKNKSFVELNKKDKEKFNFWFTSNWMWDWKLLDEKWDYIHISKLENNDKKSRRVEFKIITNSDNIIQNISNKK